MYRSQLDEICLFVHSNIRNEFTFRMKKANPAAAIAADITATKLEIVFRRVKSRLLDTFFEQLLKLTIVKILQQNSATIGDRSTDFQSCFDRHMPKFRRSLMMIQ